MNTNVWKTRDGRVIPVVDMTDDHLRNTLRMIQRAGYVHSKQFVSLLMYACSEFTPDGAADAAKQEWEVARCSKHTDAILDEAERRGIE